MASYYVTVHHNVHSNPGSDFKITISNKKDCLLIKCNTDAEISREEEGL
jgi:hypothetical protein